MSKSKILVQLLFIISLVIFTGCGGDKQEYKRVKLLDSIESYKEFLKNYPNSKYVKEIESRIDVLQQLFEIRKVLKGNNSNEKFNCIKTLEKLENVKDIFHLLPDIIDILGDNELVQLVSREGNLIFYDAVSLSDEAAKVLKKITGLDYGKDIQKWQEWWEQKKYDKK